MKIMIYEGIKDGINESFSNTSNENMEFLIDKLEDVAENLDALTTEIYKYRKYSA